MMSLQMALKIMLYFTTICSVLARPSIPSEQKNSRSTLPKHNSHQREVKIPPYMMHLYQTLTGNSKDLPRPEKEILEESDTVQSFPAKNCFVNGNHWELTFDLSPLSMTEELHLVEFRVHLPPFKKASHITLDIYCTKGEQGNLLLGSVITDMPAKKDSSWKTFNVTKLIQQHLQRGCKMDIHVDGDSQSIDIHEEVKVDHASPHKISTNQANMVFYTKDKTFIKRRSPSLLKTLSSSLGKMDELRLQKINRYNKPQTTPSNTNPSPIEESKPLCRKVDMMVDFKQIGWNNWVVYPKKYNAYRCEGTCRSPLKEPTKTTNYGFIKSILKLRNSERMECSSCVPVKMQPLSVLLHEGRDLVFRQYEDMIIVDCGFN